MPEDTEKSRSQGFEQLFHRVVTREALAVIADLILVGFLGIVLVAGLSALSLDFGVGSSYLIMAGLTLLLALIALLYLGIRRSVGNIKRGTVPQERET